MEKKFKNKDVSLGEMLIAALRAREASDHSVVPSEQIELLQASVGSFERIMDRVALFAAADRACLNAVLGHLKLPGVLESIAERNPEAMDKIQEWVKIVEGLAFHYQDETSFCANIEKMSRVRLLAAAGIDPNDTVAVAKFFAKVSESLIVGVGNPNS